MTLAQPLQISAATGSTSFPCGRPTCRTLDLKSHEEHDRVMFYSVSALFYAGDKGVILREGGCVFPEELSCSRHSKWDSTSLLLLSFRHLSEGWPQMSVVGVNSPAVTLFFSPASKLMSRSGLNWRPARQYNQVKKEERNPGKIQEWNYQST